MSVSSITSQFASYAQQVTGAASGTSARGASTSAALQEATETKAQTAKEAKNGDRVAIKKLAQEQAQEQQDSSSAPSGKGEQIDQKA